MLERKSWQRSGKMTLVFPEPTSEKWKHSSAVMMCSRNFFCFSVGTIWYLVVKKRVEENKYTLYDTMKYNMLAKHNF